MKISKLGFKQFLKNRRRSMATQHARLCPLACYLRSLGYHDPRVWGRTFATDAGLGSRVVLPKWAQKFVRDVDKTGPGWVVSILPQEALRLLKKLG